MRSPPSVWRLLVSPGAYASVSKLRQWAAVRAMSHTAVADLALETEDAELLQVCERIWDNVTPRM